MRHLSQNELRIRIRRRFIEHDREAKKALAVSLRANGVVYSIEQAAVLAGRGYEELGKCLPVSLTFGRWYGEHSFEPQIDVQAAWPEADRGIITVPLLGGVDVGGAAYLLGSGPHPARRDAEEEWRIVFPDTL